MKQIAILLLSIFLLSCSGDDYFNPVEGTWTSERTTDILILTFTKNFTQKMRIKNKQSGEFEYPDPLYEEKYTIDEEYIYYERYWDPATYSIVHENGKIYLKFSDITYIKQ